MGLTIYGKIYYNLKSRFNPELLNQPVEDKKS